MTRNWRVRTLALFAAATAVALGASACSSSGGSGSSSSSGGGGSSAVSMAPIAKDDALAAMLPANIKSSGKVVVGTDASYAPSEFLDTDNKTIIGFDIDLGNAIAQVLGVKFQFQNANFDSIIPGLGTKFDIGISSFTINADREKQVNMASYYSAGTSWAAPKGSTLNPDDACGKKVAVQKATVQVDDITARSKKCTDAGKPAITVDQYTLQSDATTAVVSGKDDANLADSPVISFAIKQTGDKLQQVGQTYDSAPYGVAVPKDQTQFAQAISGAYNKIIQGGQYMAILTKWGVQQGAVTSSSVNPTS